MLPTRLLSVQRSMALMAVALIVAVPGGLAALSESDAADGPSRVVTFHPPEPATRKMSLKEPEFQDQRERQQSRMLRQVGSRSTL